MEQRFRDPPDRSLAALKAERYTIQDVRRRRDPTDYVQSVVVLGQNAGIAITEATQVMMAYEHMDPQLRRHLLLPNEHSTIEDFIKEISAQKHVWFDHYSITINQRMMDQGETPATSWACYRTSVPI